MGRPEEPLDRDGSPVREFAFWLRDLRHRSCLTYDQLGKEAHYATSTVQAATAGSRLPTLKVTMAFVRACGGDMAQWRAYWGQVRRLLDPTPPAGSDRSVLPPWAQAEAVSQRPPTVAIEPGEDDESAPDGWFLESFSALLRLDAHPVEAWERRRIAATAGGLSELVTSVSVPRHPHDVTRRHALESEVLYGGSIEVRRQPYDSYFQNVIMLPRALRAGDRHEYALRLRIPAGQRMTPHYVHVPYQRSDYFELRVRFDPRRPPEMVWLVREAPTAVIYRREPTGEKLIPDRFGEVYASFRDMRPGMGYGICWREPEVDQIAPGS